MDLQQLEYFRVVARVGNVTQAAKELNIAQPSLSIAISKLENELGVNLFDRVSGRIRLNNIGEAFYRKTEKIFLEVSEARREVSDLAGSASKSVSVTASSSGLCTELFSTFASTHKDFRFSHFIHSPYHIRPQLEQAKVDFAISTEPIISANIEWLPLLKERLSVLASTNNPLAAKKSVSTRDLIDQKFVVHRSAFHPQGEYAEFFKDAGFEPTASFITNEFEVMAAMVELNIGISILSRQSSNKLLASSRRNLVVIPLESKFIGRTVGVARLTGHYFTSAVREFYDYTVDFFSNL